jgi:hypothetical protein
MDNRQTPKVWQWTPNFDFISDDIFPGTKVVDTVSKRKKAADGLLNSRGVQM